MAQSPTINPYVGIGSLVSQGLNSIIGALPTSPTEKDLITQATSFVQSIFYPNASLQVSIELYSIAAHAVNSYRSSLVLNGNALFDDYQATFIEMLIGSEMTNGTAPDSFLDALSIIEDNIGISDLLVPEQIPLFLATTMGLNSYTYWTGELSNPTSQWINYFSSNSGQNYVNTILWNVAAMSGALAAYGANPNGLVEPTINTVTNRMVSSLLGALTVSSGKVIFNWIPKITKPMTITQESLSDFQLNNLDKLQYGTPQLVQPVNPVVFGWRKKRSNWERATAHGECMDIRYDNGTLRDVCS